MGVMECNRTGCDNIMCSAYHSETGYICYSCLAELRTLQELKPNMGIKRIIKFMNTPREIVVNDNQQPRINLDNMFNVNQGEE